MKYIALDGREKELVITDIDDNVKSVVFDFHSKYPELDDMELANKVSEHYYHVVGIYNNRLEKVIQYFTEVVTGQCNILFREEIDHVKVESLSY